MSWTRDFLNGTAECVGRGALIAGTLLGAAVVGVVAQTLQAAEPEKPKIGLQINDSKACKGYTLLAPVSSTTTYLVDMEGRVVNTWKSDYMPGLSAVLLDNGHLLRTGQIKDPPFFGGGRGGRIQEFSWDGELVWDYEFHTDTQLPNHDVCKLPNGNVLMIVWEKKDRKDAIAAGRRPETVGDSHILADYIMEVKPTGKTTGKVVWEWHAWDHIIQEFDDEKANHGDVAAHPELIDLNFGDATIAAMIAKPEELEKLRAIGYVGTPGHKAQKPQPDWLHVNSVSYNAELDHVLLSVYEFSEIWIIDHSTTTEEAAGHKGGRQGKGGDLLCRWGNPRAYRAGTVKDQKLFGQHNAHWIDKGLPGEGRVLIFNNGVRRTGGAYSSVDEIALPVDDKGRYECKSGKPFGPDKAAWSYVAQKKTDFYAPFISGAERLPNGNTLVCYGTTGTVFEVTAKDEIVWKYVLPAKGGSPWGGPRPDGPLIGFAPKLGQILPIFLRGFMNLTPDQKKQLEAAEKETGEKLEKLLTDEQKKDFKENPPGFDEFPPAGRLMSTAIQDRLKLSNEQKKELVEMQKAVDEKLDSILNDEQKKQLKQMQEIPPFRPGGGPRPGPLVGSNGLFRAPRYAVDYPGLKDKELKPGKTIEELQSDTRPDKEPKDK